MVLHAVTSPVTISENGLDGAVPVRAIASGWARRADRSRAAMGLWVRVQPKCAAAAQDSLQPLGQETPVGGGSRVLLTSLPIQAFSVR
jgi:hypothetical protein